MNTVNILWIAVALDRRGSSHLPSPSSLHPVVPTAVRHEMGVSPIKLSSTSQAVSTHSPEPSAAPESTKVHVSTQGSQLFYLTKNSFHLFLTAVDTYEPSPQPSIIQEITESGSLRVSCSNKLHSPSSLSLSLAFYQI
jgi:hypothetical protein